MSRFLFSKKRIDGLPLPESGKRAQHHDTKVNGLLIRITSTGAKSFVVFKKIGSTPVRVKLGSYPDMTIEIARKEAQIKLAEFSKGINPNIKKKAERAIGVTLRNVFEAYLTTKKKLKPLTIKDYQKAMKETFFDWMDKPLKDITKDMVSTRHIKRGKQSKARADNAFRVLRAIFNFATEEYENEYGESLFPVNPVEKLSKTGAWYSVDRRKIVIKEEQLKPWFDAVFNLDNHMARDYLQFVLLTGLRREEAMQLRWDRVNMGTKVITIPDTKNNREHHLPLSDYLIEMFSAMPRINEYVFPGKSGLGHLVNVYKQIEVAREKSDVYFSIHDLRRSFITFAEGLDISAYAIKRLVNHSIKGDVTCGYIITDVERLRKPMQQITDYILKAAGVKQSALVIDIANWQ